MRYRVEREPHDARVYTYVGYIDDVYVGYITGLDAGSNFNIQASFLLDEFKGVKAVRAFREIIKGIERDFDIIRSRIDSKDNNEIKIVLSAGFHIIGTVSYKNEIAVELLKHKEIING